MSETDTNFGIELCHKACTESRTDVESPLPTSKGPGSEVTVDNVLFRMTSLKNRCLISLTLLTLSLYLSPTVDNVLFRMTSLKNRCLYLCLSQLSQLPVVKGRERNLVWKSIASTEAGER